MAFRRAASTTSSTSCLAMPKRGSTRIAEHDKLRAGGCRMRAAANERTAAMPDRPLPPVLAILKAMLQCEKTAKSKGS